MNVVEVKKNKKHYLNCVMPGIRAIAQQRNCNVMYNGFIPSIQKGDASKEVDIDLILQCMADDRYGAIEKHIKELCEDLK